MSNKKLKTIKNRIVQSDFKIILGIVLISIALVFLQVLIGVIVTLIYYY
jgi:hypothetical protein